MFDVDEFVAACRGALQEHTPELAVKELLSSAIAKPGRNRGGAGNAGRRRHLHPAPVG